MTIITTMSLDINMNLAMLLETAQNRHSKEWVGDFFITTWVPHVRFLAKICETVFGAHSIFALEPITTWIPNVRFLAKIFEIVFCTFLH